jgi:hypothetical protein
LSDHASGVWTDFTRPNSEYTLGEDINDRGQVVGFFSLPQFHGFLKTGNHYSIINFPGVASTIALGLNNKGVVVGNYFDDNGTQHGFVATPKGRRTSP